MSKLKLGLIGLGKVAESYLTAYQKVNAIEIAAGAEPNPERLADMTARWGMKGYAEVQEMLEAEALDAVCILAPPLAHRALTELAASRGLHVLCEKPMALSLEDGEAMIQACGQAGVKLAYGSSYRCLPPVLKAKEMIARGDLGRVHLIAETYVGGAGLEGWRDLGPHHYPTGTPGGGGMGLVDHGIHFADIMPWLAGARVEGVFGRGNRSGAPPATEYLTMFFDNGGLGQLIYHEATWPTVLPWEGAFSHGASWGVSGELLPGGDWDPQPGSIHIHGEKGALRVFHYANRLYHFGPHGVKQLPLAERVNPDHFGLQIELFAQSIISGAPLPATGQDGLAALQIILAAYESFEKKTMVRLAPSAQ